MGKHWRKYSNGPYRLGRLKGQAVVTWRDSDGKHRRRLGVLTEAEGRSAVDQFVKDLSRLRRDGVYTISDLYQVYQDDREKDGKLIEAFKANWKALKPTFGNLYADDITADLCRRYTEERCKKASQGTAWTELTRLRSCTNWAVKKRLISFKPDIWVPQKPDPKDRVLSFDEVGRLLDGCIMPHVKLFVILALATAGRTEALLQLTWDRVDFGAGTINLKLKTVINPLTKKVRKGRSVLPMNDWARVALLEAKKGALTDHVIEWDGEPIKSIRKGFTEAVRRAKLGTDVTPHTLRHTAASWLESDGIPMGQISRFLGHKTESVTRNTYAKPDTKSLEGAAKILDFEAKKSSRS
jgi:integrase